jgi:hypothetical protein
MSRYNKQNRLDEKAVSILSDYFMNRHGDRFDLQFHGIKDNTPDTDGFLRLREKTADKKMEGDYLDKVVFFQLKGFEKPINNHCYSCSTKLINFCKNINLPTILFVVSNISGDPEKKDEAQIFWYHFSTTNIEILDLKKQSSKIKIQNLNALKFGKNDFAEKFYLLIKNLAKKDEFLDLPKEILNISVELRDKVLLIASIIYLVGKVTNEEKQSIAKMLKISKRHMDDILSSLVKQNLVHKNRDVHIFKLTGDEIHKNIGLDLVHEAISKIDLDKLLSLFPDSKKKLLIYGNLGEVRHPKVFNFLDKVTAEILEYAKE